MADTTLAPFSLSASNNSVTQGGNNAFTGNNTHAGTETFNGAVVFNNSVTYAVTVDTYAAAQTSDFNTTEVHTLTLGGNVTSWATLNRAAGKRLRILIKSLVDGIFTGTTGRYDPYTGAGPIASGIARFPQPPVNLVQFSEPVNPGTQIQQSGTTANAAGQVHATMSGGAHLGDNTLQRFAYVNVPSVPASTACVVSCFVKMDDGGAPVASGSISSGDFSLVIANNLITATPTIVSLGLGLYRVYGTLTTSTTPATSAGVIKYVGQSTRGFSVTGYQVEPGTVPTGYNPAGVPNPGQGLMIEPTAATNILTLNQSSVETDLTGFTTRVGTEALLRVTSTSWVGTAAIRCVTPGGVTQEGFYVTASVASSATYTLSAWVAGTGTVQLLAYDGTTSTGGVVTTLSSSAYKRLSMTTTTGASATSLNFYVVTNGAQAITFYADGLQLEPGSYATSWMPGGTTRALEAFAITTASAITLAQGAIIACVYVDGILLPSTSPSPQYVFFHSDGSSHNRIFLRRNGVNWDAQIQDSTGANTATASWTPTGGVGWYIIGMAWNGTSVEIYALGTQQATVVTGSSLPTVMSATTVVCQTGQPIKWFATFKTKPAAADMAAYANQHDPSVPARLSLAADYFIDFGSVSQANGGNLAPTRKLTFNPAWQFAGTVPPSLYAGKQALLEFDCFGSNESDVFARWSVVN